MSELLARWEGTLACPVRGCGAVLSWEPRRTRCPHGHAFDLGRSGYCNLLQPQDKKSVHPGDSKEAVLARRRSLGRGLGASLREALLERVRQWAIPPEAVVLDVGCGEGFFLDQVVRATQAVGWGLDLSTPAIDTAARTYPDCRWVVGNADRHLPFRDGSVDLLLSITSRKNGPEFGRVLRDTGHLLVVVPDTDDLQQLREATLGKAIDKDRLASTLDALAGQFEVEQETTARSTHRLDAEALDDLLKGSYRGARLSARRRFEQIQELEVTLSYRLIGFRPRKLG
ncbi:MAG: methyltransferase domain-containing protein [Deltaproteobacteria bacterium]|nr:methyltransferase domain-containing protein [Deltaproteobacteria bacterium]